MAAAIVSGHRDTSETGVADWRRGVIRSAADEPTLALITCYPFDAVVPGGPLRWVVLAEREYDEPRQIVRTRSLP